MCPARRAALRKANCSVIFFKIKCPEKKSLSRYCAVASASIWCCRCSDSRSAGGRALPGPQKTHLLIPVPQPHLDAAVVTDKLFELLRVAAAIMIRVNNLRLELSHGIGGLLDRHRVR